MTEITTSKHKIVPVGLETNSNFTCIAMNEGGQSDPATLFINVNGKNKTFKHPERVLERYFQCFWQLLQHFLTD